MSCIPLAIPMRMRESLLYKTAAMHTVESFSLSGFRALDKLTVQDGREQQGTSCTYPSCSDCIW